MLPGPYIIHSLHEFALKQEFQLNSSLLVTVWHVVNQKSATGVQKKIVQLLVTVWRVVIEKGVLFYGLKQVSI